MSRFKAFTLAEIAKKAYVNLHPDGAGPFDPICGSIGDRAAYFSVLSDLSFVLYGRVKPHRALYAPCNRWAEQLMSIKPAQFNLAGYRCSEHPSEITGSTSLNDFEYGKVVQSLAKPPPGYTLDAEGFLLDADPERRARLVNFDDVVTNILREMSARMSREYAHRCKHGTWAGSHCSDCQSTRSPPRA
jgi:hypothetical protein